MRAPLSWLKVYLDLPIPDEEIAKILTSAGLEVEKIERTENDSIFEISLTPNLSHCMSVVGIARELAASLNLKIKRHLIRFQENPHSSIEKMVEVKIEAPTDCHRYCCRIVEKVKVGPSPAWLRERIESSGLRSINNVVDISNYVMLEFGQPLHLFDYDKIAGNKLFIRSHVKGSLVTLDDLEREIPETALMICDEKRPLAFAGVMGGKASSISETTERVLIEAAYFTPSSIRKTGKLVGLRTESSQRFERGIDPQGMLFACERAAELLAELAGGSCVKGEIDKVAVRYCPKILECRIPRVNQLLGTTLSQREIASLFERLEMRVESEKTDLLTVSIPSYREDIKSEIDLIEEVARIYGYSNLPQHPPRHISSPLPHAPLYLFENEIRKILIAQELQEFLTCNLISPKLSKLTLEKAFDKLHDIAVLHPCSLDQSILRSSLLPSLLQVVGLNLSHQNSDLAGFEVGRVHFKEGERYIEQETAAILLTGNTRPYHFETKAVPFDFFDLKGHVENFLEALGIEEVTFERSHLQNFHPGQQCRVKIEDAFVGVMGQLHPAHLKELGIEKKVYYAEFSLQELLPLRKKSVKMRPLPIYPGSERDWTLTVKDELSIGVIPNLIQEISSPFLERVELLGLYKSEKIGKDRKNVTLRFYYRDQEKTMEFEEVEKEHARILTIVAQKLQDSVPL